MSKLRPHLEINSLRKLVLITAIVTCANLFFFEGVKAEDSQEDSQTVFVVYAKDYKQDSTTFDLKNLIPLFTISDFKTVPADPKWVHINAGALKDNQAHVSLYSMKNYLACQVDLRSGSSSLIKEVVVNTPNTCRDLTLALSSVTATKPLNVYRNLEGTVFYFVTLEDIFRSIR